jgi:cell division inhibitor SulA
MNHINYLNTKELSLITRNITIDKPNWCDVRTISNTVELSRQYTEICQNNDLDNKWILMVNPEDKQLQQLSTEGKIDPKRILKVNIHQRNISLKTIKEALEKGHCSAVILCNATFDKAQLDQLTQFAEKGQTKCIILTKQTQNLLNQNLLTKCVTLSNSSLLLH